ncbi:hypothetical protein PMAYCL1PPCAC_26421, partial [Pristionchus mayeri]
SVLSISDGGPRMQQYPLPSQTSTNGKTDDVKNISLTILDESHPEYDIFHEYYEASENSVEIIKGQPDYYKSWTVFKRKKW